MGAKLPLFGLAIDWETSGYSTPSYAARHQGVSFGAVIFEVESLEPVESLYRELQFDEGRYLWDLGAERVHGLTRAHLKAHGVQATVAAVELGNLIVKYLATEEVLLLGHRVYFDRAFTDQLMDTIGIRLSYHPTVIDSASMATVLLETSRSEEVFQLLGLPPRGTHNALEDVCYTLAAVARMKDLFLKGIITEMTDASNPAKA